MRVKNQNCDRWFGIKVYVWSSEVAPKSRVIRAGDKLIKRRRYGAKSEWYTVRAFTSDVTRKEKLNWSDILSTNESNWISLRHLTDSIKVYKQDKHDCLVFAFLYSVVFLYICSLWRIEIKCYWGPLTVAVDYVFVLDRFICLIWSLSLCRWSEFSLVL